jgi:hypothetical protein
VDANDYQQNGLRGYCGYVWEYYTPAWVKTLLKPEFLAFLRTLYTFSQCIFFTEAEDLFNNFGSAMPTGYENI